MTEVREAVEEVQEAMTEVKDMMKEVKDMLAAQGETHRVEGGGVEGGGVEGNSQGWVEAGLRVTGLGMKMGWDLIRKALISVVRRL